MPTSKHDGDNNNSFQFLPTVNIIEGYSEIIPMSPKAVAIFVYNF